MNASARHIDRESILSRIPPAFWKIPYDSEGYPGSSTPAELLDGANCQRFAYAVLDLFELSVPPLRSSDLWADSSVTIRADEPYALDLVLFGGGRNGWGAHVGVYLGDERVLHLCKEIGVPAVWKLEDFESRPYYRPLVGYKRVLANAGPEAR